MMDNNRYATTKTNAALKQRSALRKLTRVLPLTGVILSSACASAGGCDLLSLKAYARDFNIKLAAEAAAAPQGAVWPQAIGDYVKLRDDVKACSGV
jgi:cytosine/uracil/thiamine/allantoin permease